LLAAALKDELHPSTGLVIRNCLELLAAKEALNKNGITLSLTAKFIEVYEEHVVDLISGRQVTVRRDTGEVSGAVESSINTIEEALSVFALTPPPLTLSPTH
jgi:hypothetical protein